MKQGFSSLDVKVIAHELSQAICGLRLHNAYDLSSRIFLFKFAKPGVRHQLLVDSGFRCHLTKFARTTAAEPSAFVARLRKFLKTRRVTGVVQVGTDRIIEITFSDGQFRLFLEFFSGGNVILTGTDLKILALLRIVPAERGQVETRVGLQYSLETRKNYGGVPKVDRERVQNGLQAQSQRAAATVKKAKKSKPGDALRKALGWSLTEFPPVMIEDALYMADVKPGLSPEDVLHDEPTLDKIVAGLQQVSDVFNGITTQGEIKGYIVTKPAKKRADVAVTAEAGSEVDKENVAMLYEEFHPFRPRHLDAQPEIQILEFQGYNTTVDEFFSSMESQKVETQLMERQDQAKRKLNVVRNDHEKRVQGLQQVQELNVRKAQAIEGNIERVQETIAAINGLIAQGMDWVEIDQLIEMEKARQNPVAQIIKLPLKLDSNSATLLLAEPDFEEDEEEDADVTESDSSDSEIEKKPGKKAPAGKPEDKRLAIDLDLGLSPWANAREYYDQKKSAAVKEQKTLDSSAKALKSAEEKVTADMRKAAKKEVETLRPLRKQLWFEKFYYFITSEGYLVIGGRDPQQDDLLYKKYLQKGDIFVHADIKDAAPCIVKNKPGLSDQAIPPNSLAQAGTLAVASSTAWDSKAIMAAWWVTCDQVHKIDDTGHLLDAGAFLVKGEKNYLPPAQLLLGFGVMFRITPESKAKHLKHRMDVDQQSTLMSDTTTAARSEPVETDGANDTKDEIEDAGQERQHNDNGSDIEDGAMDDGAKSEADEEDEDPESRALSNPLQSPHHIEEGMDSLVLDESERDSEGAEAADDADEEAAAEPEVEEADAANQVSNVSETTSQAEATTKNRPQVRGKHGKRAKIKNKYADQDDEDRARAMQLLGSAAGAGGNASKNTPAARAAKEAEAQAQKERRRAQHQQAQTKARDAVETRRQVLAAGGELMDAEEIAELRAVDEFVGTPLPGDAIVDAVVVCGPWDALGPKLRWRVKMQPGTIKRGKALKEIFDTWHRSIAAQEKKRLPAPDEPEFDAETGLRREGELIRRIKHTEVVGLLPVGKIRLVMAGGSASGGGGGDKGKGGKGGGGGGGGKQAKGGKGGKGGKKK